MAMDEHYNDLGGLPKPLEDHEPSDMPATIGVFVAILAVAAISFVVLALFERIG